jgi:aquaporin NIP
MKASCTSSPASGKKMSGKTIRNSQLARKLAAEGVGTFAMVFAGCGAIMVGLSHGEVCAVFGLVIMAMIFATGHVSGAHFNPSVTLGFAIIGRFPWRQVPLYILTQILASIAAIALLSITIGTHETMGGTALNPEVTAVGAFLLETSFTFMLMFVITSVATDSRATGQVAGIAIGGTVAFLALFGGPLTGASMNPARSLGPALISGNWNSIWLYLSAPVLGAALGALCYNWLRCEPDADELTSNDAKGCC